MTRSSSTGSAGTLSGRCFASIANMICAYTCHFIVQSSFTTSTIYNISNIRNRQRGFRNISRYHAQATSFWWWLKHLKSLKQKYFIIKSLLFYFFILLQRLVNIKRIIVNLLIYLYNVYLL